MKHIAYLLGGGYTEKKINQYNTPKQKKKQIPALFRKETPVYPYKKTTK